jgi:hypothetical protein
LLIEHRFPFPLRERAKVRGRLAELKPRHPRPNLSPQEGKGPKETQQTVFLLRPIQVHFSFREEPAPVALH